MTLNNMTREELIATIQIDEQIIKSLKLSNKMLLKEFKKFVDNNNKHLRTTEELVRLARRKEP